MLIVIDSSAIVAILFEEPSAAVLLQPLSGDPERVMSAASYVETGTVLAGRRLSDKAKAADDLDAFLTQVGVTVVPVDDKQAQLALRARIAHRRGMGHGGSLNFGDAFSYALAKSLDAPLLYVGDDFTATDVRKVL